MNEQITESILGTPSPKQLEFLRARARHVAFGGARGGGKSWAVRCKAILLCLTHAGIRVMILRRTIKELENNHIFPLQKALQGIAKLKKDERRFVFDNGSSIAFGYCDNDGDAEQYQGAEFDVLFLDEATQLKEDWIRRLGACVRGVNDFPKRMYYTCNPGGVSHMYFKRLFIDRRYLEGENPEDYVFIQSLVDDNHALMKADPFYKKSLESLQPRLRRAWLEGRWDVFEGQVFEEFTDNPRHYQDRRWTHVIEPFDLSRREYKNWTYYRSYDYGYARPFSCGWWAVDPDGTLYRFMELYGCTGVPNQGVRWDVERQFKEIAEIERTHPYLKGKQVFGIADPSIWRSDVGESIAECAMRHGVFFTPGDNHRIPGWMQCHSRLTFDENGVPGMYVFSTCRHFIRTVPALTYSTVNVEDVDSDLEDHVADEWRYLCMARPMKGREERREGKKEVMFSDPLKRGR